MSCEGLVRQSEVQTKAPSLIKIFGDRGRDEVLELVGVEVDRVWGRFPCRALWRRSSRSASMSVAKVRAFSWETVPPSVASDTSTMLPSRRVCPKSKGYFGLTKSGTQGFIPQEALEAIDCAFGLHKVVRRLEGV
jgi:hypothetical protein